MLKKIYTVITVCCLLGCGHSIKMSNAAVNSLKAHKTIAILPFEITMASKLEKAKKFTEQESGELAKYLSFALQQHLYQSFKKKRKRFLTTVTILSADITNSIFLSKRLNSGEIFGSSKQEICKILKVDAIIFGQAVFGKKTNLTKDQLLYPGKIEMNISIFDSIVTPALWRYSDTRKQLSGSRGIYSEENKYQQVLAPWALTIEHMFQNITADFPYKKK